MTGCPAVTLPSSILEWTRLVTRTRYLGFVVLVFLSLALWWHSLAATFALALAKDSYTHILLVLPLSLGMIFLDLQTTRRTESESGVWIAVILLSAALLLHGLAVWKLQLSADTQLSIQVFTLVLWWIGSVLICFGLNRARALLFPLAFLFLLIPSPEQVVNGITAFLQHWSALATEGLFRAAHVPVTRDAIVLSLPEMDIEVARECSSIRSSTMLLITGLVLAHLFLGSWWRKIVFVLAAIPLSVAKNAVRIFTIVELGREVNPQYFNGELHHSGGIVFFLATLIVDIGLLWSLRRGESKRGRAIAFSTEIKKPVS